MKVPHPLPQPSGCRADTQIACPGSNHRICNVQRCDGEEDCPRLPGQQISWDETEGCVTTTTPSPTTTTTTIMTTTGERWLTGCNLVASLKLENNEQNILIHKSSIV